MWEAHAAGNFEISHHKMIYNRWRIMLHRELLMKILNIIHNDKIISLKYLMFSAR